MVKEPRPGRVKTRLGNDVGMIVAAWWFRHQVISLLRRLRDPRWSLVLAVSPDVDGMNSRVWPAGIKRTPQGEGDLGDRMNRMFRQMPKGRVCIIGADIPGINQNRIANAFKCLGTNDAVIGPADDGGYWLIGLKRLKAQPPRMFEHVRWSTEFAMADTIASIPDLRVGLTSTLRDIDTLQDLRNSQ
jgi:rSAM/selenodomain-associated transferase 1